MHVGDELRDVDVHRALQSNVISHKVNATIWWVLPPSGRIEHTSYNMQRGVTTKLKWTHVPLPTTTTNRSPANIHSSHLVRTYNRCVWTWSTACSHAPPPFHFVQITTLHLALYYQIVSRLWWWCKMNVDLEHAVTEVIASTS